MIEVPTKVMQGFVLPVVAQVNTVSIQFSLLAQSWNVDVSKLREIGTPGIRLDQACRYPRNVLFLDSMEPIHGVRLRVIVDDLVVISAE